MSSGIFNNQVVGFPMPDQRLIAVGSFNLATIESMVTSCPDTTGPDDRLISHDDGYVDKPADRKGYCEVCKLEVVLLGHYERCKPVVSSAEKEALKTLAWLGDAVLAVAARNFIVTSSGSRNGESFQRLTSNENLAKVYERFSLSTLVPEVRKLGTSEASKGNAVELVYFLSPLLRREINSMIFGELGVGALSEADRDLIRKFPIAQNFRPNQLLSGYCYLHAFRNEIWHKLAYLSTFPKLSELKDSGFCKGYGQPVRVIVSGKYLHFEPEPLGVLVDDLPACFDNHFVGGHYFDGNSVEYLLFSDGKTVSSFDLNELLVPTAFRGVVDTKLSCLLADCVGWVIYLPSVDYAYFQLAIATYVHIADFAVAFAVEFIEVLELFHLLRSMQVLPQFEHDRFRFVPMRHNVNTVMVVPY